MIRRLLVASAALFVLVQVAAAQPAIAPQPSGPHPRLLLDEPTRAALKAQAKKSGSAVAASVDRCKAFASNRAQYTRDLYMGLDWAQYLQSCLIAWAATGDDAHARTAIVYFTALIDDLDNVGDGKGGNNAARRDSGFAIRAMGPYTALAYDWLHDHPLMTEALRARARERWAAWTTWYLANGYRARSPSTNYHAGYLAAVTFIAIAQGNEAGREGATLWRLVADEIWGNDMTKALAPDGVLDGGDWGEGWQYGPLSIAEYAAAARAMVDQGVKLDRVQPWLDGVLRRHVYALSPGGGTFVGGDTQAETANLPPHSNTLAAVMLGDASPQTKAWAAAELARLPRGKLEFPLYVALAEAAAPTAEPVPRASWPLTYLVAGTQTFFARTDWSKDAIWTVMQCNHTIDVDHAHPNAGNFVLSRGGDDLVVDPTPYGSLSTLTSNAPTVVSAHLPDDYKPSQAWWSERTGFPWMRQTASGIVALRCDYADQYKFQDRPSDVPFAQRDLVVIPHGGNAAATAIVVDRAMTGDAARPMHLRFRTPTKLQVEGAGGVGIVGRSKIAIETVWSSGGKPERVATPGGSCFSGPWTRGNCAAARFAVEDWRLVVPGPAMTAITRIELTDARGTVAPVTAAKDGDVTVVSGAPATGAFALVLGGGDTLRYKAPAGRHVVLDGPDGDAAVVSASKDGDRCAVTVAAGGAGTRLTGRPRIFALDAACVVSEDAAVAGAATPPPVVDAGPLTPPVPVDAAGGGGGGGGGGSTPRIARSGCCGAEAAPGASLAMAGFLAVAWLWLGARRRRKT